MNKPLIAALLATAALPGVARAQTAASPLTSAARYDAAQRVTGTIAPDPDGSGLLHYAATRNTYDGAGRLVRVETGELSTWQPESIAPSAWAGFTVLSQIHTDYDAMDHKTVERASDGATPDTTYALTQYSYNGSGLLECTAVRMNRAAFSPLPASACTLGAEGTGGPDRITRNVYDDAGQLLKVQKAYGTSLQQDYATYSYSSTGKQLSVTDANGNRAEMTYDGFDREASWVFPSPTTAGQANASDYESYGYDPDGNRTSWRKRDGRVFTFNFDALSRVTSKLVPDGCAPIGAGACPAPSATRDIYYGYDLRGLQTYARFDSASGGDAVTSSYDGFGRLTSSITSMGGVSRAIGSGYDADGNRTSVTHPDGQAFTYTYDGLDRFTTGYQPDGSGIVVISYDPQGRRLSKDSDGLTSYGYDPVSRLTSLSESYGGQSWGYANTFGYNPAGQITTETRGNDAYAFTGSSNVSRGYQVNGLNQYTSAGTATLAYDANGNLTSNGTIGYGYDAENRLITASNGVALAYDPLGRLWQSSGGAAGTTQFVYDGDQLTVEYGSAGNVLRRYFHGTGEDDPLVWYEGAGTSYNDARFLKSDHEGSIVAAVRIGGQLAGINAYDEYGVPNINNIGRFGYTGQAWLPELKLWYYKARIYDPALGRFDQTDPVGYKDQINLYAYVGNDPVNKVDHTGERISVVIHEVGFGQYHTKIVVVPDDQKTFRNDNRFQSDANGVRFMTIGGGPDTKRNIFGPLVGDINRPKDVSKTLSGESLEVARIAPGKGDNENNLINRMVGVARSYKDDKPYSLFPSAKGNDYNSNSFAYGVLGAVGAKNVPIPQGYSVPGADKPLPADNFCKPGMSGCGR